MEEKMENELKRIEKELEIGLKQRNDLSNQLNILNITLERLDGGRQILLTLLKSA